MPFTNMGKFARRWNAKSSTGGGRRSFRLLFWATLCAGLCGISGFGLPLDELLRSVRNLALKHPASGDIVVVGIDDKSLANVSGWPWPRGHHADMTDRIAGAGAKRIFFDIDFSSRSTSSEDGKLEAALARHQGTVVLPTLAIVDPLTMRLNQTLPLPQFARHTELASIGLKYNWRGIVWNLPYFVEVSGTSHPGFAAKLAGKTGPAEEAFRIDYSIDWRTIPVVSAVDLLEGRVPAKLLAGKDVVIGAISPQLGDTFFAPGGGNIPGVYIHALGAETLKSGVPRDYGWLPAFMLAFGLSLAATRMKSSNRNLTAITGGLALALAGPFALDALRIFVDVAPALLLLVIVGSRLAWLRYRAAYSASATIHPVSGLPNMSALRDAKEGIRRPLVVARIANFAEIASSLAADQERALIEQISARLTLGSAGHKLYQGDQGVFAWFADDEMAVTLTDHLNALHTLFRSPVVLAGNQVDLTIAFGVEVGSDRSTANRLGSALMAAEEAAAAGLRWKYYDAARLKEAPWRLSLLSQLDAAIDAGDLWIAYQPKLDLRSRRTVGAEALVRWTHPEKGPISPAEFVLAAEQSGRIHKLTTYVLERAIQSAAALNRRGVSFSVAVNLSARLIDDVSLPDWVGALLVGHGLAPELLTLEITETAALGTSSAHLDNLARLRDLGVQISVDDYGTGLSTLDYLKKIPANEIKIDRSFVQAMHRSEGDRVIVNSTIQLAHSLGRRVVAEGVEDRETLYALSLMGCDLAQGFFVGRPMPWLSLARQMLQEREEDQAAVG